MVSLFALELVVFPFLCGVLLDVFTLPLFYGVGLPTAPGTPADVAPMMLFGQDWQPWLQRAFSFLQSDSSLNLLLAPIVHPLVSGTISRLAFHAYAAPFSYFYHWLMGTLFMFHFANLISMIRKAFRPGLFWYARIGYAAFII